MTAPNGLELDGTSNRYRSHFGDVEHSFESLAAARHALRLVGLRLGAKTDASTWRIELMELASPEADFCAPLSIGFNKVFGRGKP